MCAANVGISAVRTSCTKEYTMSVATLLLKRRRALYTSDSSTVICAARRGV